MVFFCYCTKCHVFFYLTLEEKYFFEHKDCYIYELANFCQNCGELNSDDSIYCYKAGYLIFKKNICLFTFLY